MRDVQKLYINYGFVSIFEGFHLNNRSDNV